MLLRELTTNLKEKKVEMCSEECCGVPVTECSCGPSCKHCECHAKNKKMNEFAPAIAAMLPTLGWAVAELLLNPSKTAKWDTTDAGSQIYNKLVGEHGNEIADDAATEFNKRLADDGPSKHLLKIYQNIMNTNDVPDEFKSMGMIGEVMTSGATGTSGQADVVNPSQAYGHRKRDKKGIPKAPQKKNPDGTAKNALDIKNNLMGGETIKR